MFTSKFGKGIVLKMKMCLMCKTNKGKEFRNDYLKFHSEMSTKRKKY